MGSAFIVELEYTMLHRKAAAQAIDVRLSKDEHFSKALVFGGEGHFPLDVDDNLDPDMEYARSWTIKDRNNLQKERHRAMGAVACLAQKLEPLTQMLRSFQPQKVGQVTKGAHLGIFLVAAVLLCWPDITLAKRSSKVSTQLET